jgi:hypothetical protein
MADLGTVFKTTTPTVGTTVPGVKQPAAAPAQKPAVAAPKPITMQIPEQLQAIQALKAPTQELGNVTSNIATLTGAQTTATAEMQEAKEKASREAFDKAQSDIKSYHDKMGPFVPTKNNVGNIANLFLMVGILASSIGGKNSSAAGMNAQAALTGVLKGWQTGNADYVAQQKAVYDENVKYLTDKIQETKDTMKETLDAINKYGIGVDHFAELSGKLKSIGADLAAETAKKSGLDATIKQLTDQENLLNKFNDTVIKANAESDRSREAALRRASMGTGAGGAGLLGPESIDYLVELARQGDLQAVKDLIGSSYGNVGKANRDAFIKGAIKAGLSPSTLAQAQTMFAGTMAGERALGTQAGRISGAIGALKETVPLAIQASQAVDRTQFPSINSIEIAISRGTGDTNVVKFNAFNQALVNDYAMIMRRGGATTDESSKRANEILTTAYSQGQYQAGVDALNAEATAVQNGLRSAKDVVSGKAPQGGISAAAPSVGTVKNGYRFKGGNPADPNSWEKVLK